MLTKSLMQVSRLNTMLSVRAFSQASRYNGTNDMIRQQKREARKYGMKRHFNDHEKMDLSASPVEHYRMQLQEEDFAPYSDQVKQAFSLVNGNDTEIAKAKSQRLISM